MKKFTRLSLIAAIAVSGFSANAFAADSISEAFKNGTLKGALKSYYFAQSFDDSATKDSSIWVNGGSLNYVTAPYNGLVLGATLQTSHVTSIDDESDKTKGTLDASGSVLSESYVEYTYDNTIIKGGRQFVSTPMIAGSGSRLIKESFEAYLIKNTDLHDTTIVAGLITKYQKRTDGDGNVGKFNKIGNDGIQTVYVKNTSISNLDVKFQYADFVDDQVNLYFDTKYDFGPAYVSAQYLDTNYDDGAIESGSLFGLKVGTKISSVDLFAAFTSSDDKGDIFHGIGGGSFSQYTSTTKSSGEDALKADTDAWQIGAGYTYKKLKMKARYSSFDRAEDNKDLEEITLNFEYKFNKTLTAQVDFSILDYEADNADKTDLRTRIIYSF